MYNNISPIGQQNQDFSSYNNSEKKKIAEAHADNVLLRASIGKNGKFEKPTPDKILESLSEEIASIQQPEEDSFNSEKEYFASCSRLSGNDIKTGISTTLEILALAKALDSQLSDMFGYSVKDLIQWGINKIKNKNTQTNLPVKPATEDIPKTENTDAAGSNTDKLNISA